MKNLKQLLSKSLILSVIYGTILFTLAPTFSHTSISPLSNIEKDNVSINAIQKNTL